MLLLRKVAEYITRILRVFGIAGEDEIGLCRETGSGAAGAVAGEGAAPLLDAFADFRTAVRSAAKAGISDVAAAQASLKEVLAVCDRCATTPNDSVNQQRALVTLLAISYNHMAGTIFLLG